MAKKLPVIFLLILILAVSSVFVFKDHFFKICLINYFKNNFKGQCKIEKAHISSNGIEIENLIFSNENIDLKIQKEYTQFRLQKLLKIIFSKITLENVSLKIKNLEKIKSALSNTKDNKSLLAIHIFPLVLDLKNIKIEIDNTNNFTLKTNFSFNGNITADNFGITDIDISDFVFKANNFQISQLQLKKSQNYLYALKIPHAIINNKEFKNFLLPLKIEKDRVLFPRAKNILFGENAYMSAVLDFAGYKKFCFNANLTNASFSNIIAAAGGEENISMGGLFEGHAMLCWQDNGFSVIECNFSNTKGGLVNIKKEASLEFLRQYLDEPSYIALVDNLKNYEYNIGTLNIRKKEGVVSLNMDFSSEAMGKRNITINFHNADSRAINADLRR